MGEYSGTRSVAGAVGVAPGPRRALLSMSPRDDEGFSTLLWNDGTEVRLPMPLGAGLTSFIVEHDSVVATFSNGTTTTVP